METSKIAIFGYPSEV